MPSSVMDGNSHRESITGGKFTGQYSFGTTTHPRTILYCPTPRLITPVNQPHSPERKQYPPPPPSGEVPCPPDHQPMVKSVSHTPGLAEGSGVFYEGWGWVPSPHHVLNSAQHPVCHSRIKNIVINGYNQHWYE
eukprot:763521-Hanusia_phi.AAC.20